MSKKQYEDFLVEIFFGWAKDHLKVGEKLHFKSPDDNNSLELYKAFKRRATSYIILEEENIIYFEINNIKVIPVLHSMIDPG